MCGDVNRIIRVFSSNLKEVRLNKFLSEIGVCSRRTADKLIESGRVVVNTKTALLGTKVSVLATPLSSPESDLQTSKIRLSSNDVILVDGKPINEKVKRKIYLALNKPVGIVCTSDSKREKNNIIDFLNYPSKERLFHIGRLDKPSCGLILLTNDGDIVNKILRAEFNHEKEYLVQVDKPLTSQMLIGMSSGVPIFGGTVTTNQCPVTQINQTTFNIILTQGLNRQIRRMCQYFDYEVVALQRVRIMNVLMGSLAVGEYRDLTQEEVSGLMSVTTSEEELKTTNDQSNQIKSPHD